MNFVIFHKQPPLLSLIILCLAYTLVGWYLSAHHIVWFVGAFVIVFALAVGWKSSHWLEQLLKGSSWEIVTVLIMSLVVSIVIALATTLPLFLTLILSPLATVFLAKIEMYSAGFNKLNTVLLLTILASLGLAIGEIIDLSFFPSMRF